MSTLSRHHPKVESPHTDAWLVALGKGDLMQKEELEKTKNWLVGDEKGVTLRACLVSPSKTRQATFWAHPKVESPQTDAWRVALGKGDLMQKEELEKTKNWLVGDEKGVKLRACLVSPSKTRLATYWAHPKVESPHTDAWLVALGIRDLMQKEELKKTKNWLLGVKKGVKLMACLVSPSKTRQATYWAHPKVESPQTDAWRVALGKGDPMQKEELEKTKNWLVGDEKGVKLRACLVSPNKTM